MENEVNTVPIPVILTTHNGLYSLSPRIIFAPDSIEGALARVEVALEILRGERETGDLWPYLTKEHQSIIDVIQNANTKHVDTTPFSANLNDEGNAILLNFGQYAIAGDGMAVFWYAGCAIADEHPIF